MFVYQSNTARQVEPSKSKVEHYFRCPERWSRRDQSHSIVIVLCALLFGGVAKAISFLPVTACVGTIFAMAWVLGEETAAGEPSWARRLSLASTVTALVGRWF